jgi:hypothetical protein
VARAVLLAYFERDELPRLLAEAQAADFPPDARIYLGSYGVGAALGDQIARAGYGYAPMFHITPGWYWERRRLPKAEEGALSPGSGGLAGPLPGLNELLRLPPARRLTWGIELGRRFRDELRAAGRAGVSLAAWQLDEIQAEAAGPLGREYRDLTRGVLRGLVFGRPALGDRAWQGFVWWAHTALSLPRARLTPELAAFWRILNRAARGVVGEEYPEFSGDPRAAARAAVFGQRGLQLGGPVRQALARKYVAGLTPGYRRAAGLRGNVHGWPREQVNAWRQAYLDTRLAAGVAGFAEFDWRFENNRAVVMRDVLRELARSLNAAR